MIRWNSVSKGALEFRSIFVLDFCSGISLRILGFSCGFWRSFVFASFRSKYSAFFIFWVSRVEFYIFIQFLYMVFYDIHIFVFLPRFNWTHRCISAMAVANCDHSGVRLLVLIFTSFLCLFSRMCFMFFHVFMVLFIWSKGVIEQT